MNTEGRATRARDAIRQALRAPMVTRELPDGLKSARFGRREGRESFTLKIGSSTTEAEAKEWLKWIAWALDGAHDFTLEDTPSEVDENGLTVTPATTDDESTFFNAGLVAMPFPKVTFSYRQPDGNHTLLIGIADRPDDPMSPIRTVEIFETKGIGLSAYALSTHLVRMGGPKEAELITKTYRMSDKQRARVDAGEAVGDVMASIHLKELIDPFLIGPPLLRLLERQGPVTKNSLVCDADMLVYLLVMLGSTSTALQRVEPGKNANRIRMKKGLPPAGATTMVRLIPRAISDDIKAEGDAGNAWRRIHWRRSHARHLTSGKTVIVCRHIVGYRRLDGTELEANGYVMTKRLIKEQAIRQDDTQRDRAPARQQEEPGRAREPRMPGRLDVEHLAAEVLLEEAQPHARARGNAMFETAMSQVLPRRNQTTG